MLSKPFPYYTGKSNDRSPRAQTTRSAELNRAIDYIPGPDLINAVNAALLLEHPLLLTGEPGTGKTQLAFSLSEELKCGSPLVFETKSASLARDLFYTYDALTRFLIKKGDADDAKNAKEYITYNALGRAILHTHDFDEIKPWVPKGFSHEGKRQFVVLIDEVDKAPRDFPNDILNEVEHMYFKVPELDNKQFTVGDEDLRPILILTSNSEKHLPDAFLRRCIYHHIPFPEPERLKEIVAARIGQFRPNSQLLSDALGLFLDMRDIEGLQKRPATGELLVWLLYLTQRGVSVDDSLKVHKAIVKESIGALVKEKDYREAAEALVDNL
jgi:MoxR-like ATPase